MKEFNFISRPVAHQPGKATGIYHAETGIVSSQVAKLTAMLTQMFEIGTKKNPALAELFAQRQTNQSKPNMAAEQAKATTHSPRVG